MIECTEGNKILLLLLYSVMSIDSCFCWELLKPQFRCKSITKVFVVQGHAQREKHGKAVIRC